MNAKIIRTQFTLCPIPPLTGVYQSKRTNFHSFTWFPSYDTSFIIRIHIKNTFYAAQHTRVYLIHQTKVLLLHPKQDKYLIYIKNKTMKKHFLLAGIAVLMLVARNNKPASELTSPESGITVEVYTNEPGIQSIQTISSRDKLITVNVFSNFP